MKAYVISLPQASDRRNRFFSCAKAHGWDVELFPAVSPQDLIFTHFDGNRRSVRCGSVSFEVAHQPHADGYLIPAEIACAMSHIMLWCLLAESAEGAFCIFEDDAVIEKPHSEVPLPGDADFVFLNDRVSALIPEYPNSKETERLHESNVYAPLVPGCGMEAYLVTRNGALRALPIFTQLRLPIDLHLMANGTGTHQANHFLAAYGSPQLRLMVAMTTIARCDDRGISYIRGDGKKKLIFGSGGLHILGWITCAGGEVNTR